MNGAYSSYFGFTKKDGSIVVYWNTNDDLDLGEPSEYAEATYHLKDKKAFLNFCGCSRIGCIGTIVSVYLDGKEIKRKEDI